MGKKPFSYKEHWGQVIYRVSRGGIDYIGATVRKKYAEDDIEKYGPNTFIGLETTPVFDKVTDNDPESETYLKRITPEGAQPTKTRTSFNIKFTPETVKNFKELVGVNPMGETRFVYIFREHPFEAPNVDDFWEKKMSDVYNEVVRGIKDTPLVEKASKK